MTSVKLPLVAMVPHREVERLREKFAETGAAIHREEFWVAVQRAKQPVIEDQPDTLPPYLRRTDFGDDYHGPIG